MSLSGLSASQLNHAVIRVAKKESLLRRLQEINVQLGKLDAEPSVNKRKRMKKGSARSPKMRMGSVRDKILHALKKG